MQPADIARLEKAVRLELVAMSFYRKASRYVEDEGLRHTFEHLAREEEDHARSLHSQLGGLPGLDTLYREVEDRSPLETMTQEAILEKALDIELAMEQTIRKTVTHIQSKSVQAAFQDNARDTIRHFHLLSSEYTRLFMKVPRIQLPPATS